MIFTDRELMEMADRNRLKRVALPTSDRPLKNSYRTTVGDPYF